VNKLKTRGDSGNSKKRECQEEVQNKSNNSLKECKLTKSKDIKVYKLKKRKIQIESERTIRPNVTESEKGCDGK
jgi:hypothetical protein